MAKIGRFLLEWAKDTVVTSAVIVLIGTFAMMVYAFFYGIFYG